MPTLPTQGIIALLFQYRYLVLYPATAIEGPIVTMAAGFLVSLRLLNPLIALLVVTAGDMTSDLFFYGLGFLSGMSQYFYKLIKHFDFESRRDRFIRLFDRHGGKMVIGGKLAHSLAGVVFIGAGYSKINIWRVMRHSFAGALLKAIIFLAVGYLAGAAYERYAQRFEWWALAFSIASLSLLALLFYMPKSIRRKILGSENETSRGDK